MCTSAYGQFPATTSNARAARLFAVATVTRALPRAGVNVVDDCELVIGELVANAINAAANLIDVCIQIHHARIELAVTDDAHSWPVLHPPNTAATRGRGLQIVDALATSWGVTIADDERKIAWAHLPCDPLETIDVPCRFR